MPRLEGAEGFVHWAGHGRKEGVGANVPACLIVRAKPRIAGADFPHELYQGTLRGKNPALG